MRLPLPIRLPLSGRSLAASGRPSSTALAVTLWRALEQRRPARQRIVSDPFAELFLDPVQRAALGPLSLATPLTDRVIAGGPAGLQTFVLCRHRAIDEALLAALGRGAEQVLILGAGYDSRAYRLSRAIAGRRVIEVDLPGSSRAKAAVVAAHPEAFGHVTVVRVESDFSAQRLDETLRAAGIPAHRPTAVVWEGVVPYLDDAAVGATLDALAAFCGPGSTLGLDLWDGRGGDDIWAPLRRLAASSLALAGEPVRFVLPSAQVTRLLGEHGWEVLDVADHRELTRRYATAGRRCVPGLSVVTAGRR